MREYNHSKIELSIKDSTKGQKIAAALYLMTEHLSDTDPIKCALRAQALCVLDAADNHFDVGTRINQLLEVAVMARLISEKNASIISLELHHFFALAKSEGDSSTSALRRHFADQTVMDAQTATSAKKTLEASSTIRQSLSRSSHSIADLSNIGPVKASNKADRQEQIVSFINERKSAAIKDIALLFPEISEKTIQRELGTLSADGRITKRGAKRWSVYMAVTA